MIARVGSVELTREQALEYIDTSHNNVESQLNAYVGSWINAELINQEAQRSKPDQSEELNHRLNDVKRQLVNQMFLDRYLNGDSVEIGEQALHQYYDTHQYEFLAREFMVKLHVAIFGSRDRASAFTTTFMKTSNWESALADTNNASNVVNSPPLQYYSQHTLYPPELWKIATTLSLNDISFPVKTSSGYAVLQLTDVVREGKPSPFELVRDEVHARMIIEHRRTKYTDLLGTLRKRYTVEIYTSTAQQPDTTRLETHE